MNLSFNFTAPIPWSTIKLVTRIGSVGNKPRLGMPEKEKKTTIEKIKIRVVKGIVQNNITV